MRAAGAELVLATYNVHRFVGRDGRSDPARVAAVVHELGADVVALQEVLFPDHAPEHTNAAEILPGCDAFELVIGATRIRQGRRFGNAVLARPRVLDFAALDLTVPPQERRGALDVRLEVGGEHLHVVVAHLGLFPRERRIQFERLRKHLAGVEAPLLAVLGDFNEWRRGTRSLVEMERAMGASLPFRTFPTPRPLLALDRIWVRPAERMTSLRVHRTPLSALASDHFPVVVTIGGPLPPEESEPPSQDL
jgi:endonuclease/exonuclease/phosphatase family metal-dependent hydrolase